MDEKNNQGSIMGKNVIRLDEMGEIESKEKIRQMAEVYRLTPAELEEQKIIFSKMRDKKVLNVFRELRTKIMQKASADNFSLLVTSVGSGGGSSFMAKNIAASIALDQSKTALVVECNVGGSDNSWQIPYVEYGLSDYLYDPSIALDEIIYATGVPRLRVVPVGSATEIGTEYFTSYRMRQFHDELRGRYHDRYIIMDAPPFGESADAQIIAELADYVLICVPYGLVTPAQIDKAIASVPREKVIGMIFNN